MVMARRGGLTVKAVENLQVRAERYEVPDPGCAGLYLQIHPSGVKSWAYRYRFAGKSRKLTIGTAYTDKGVEVIGIGDARDIADEARVSVARRIDPIEAKRSEHKRAAIERAAAENTLRAVAKEYLKHRKDLRSVDHRKKVFERLIFPALGERSIESISRREIMKLLDQVAKDRGPVMADYVLATLRGLLNWHAVRSEDDDYISPIRRGMAQTSTKERARKRTLSEIEIRALWRAADEDDLFGRYLQFVLLTATRRNEAARMRRSEIEGDDWTIPAARYKTKLDHLVPLPTAAVTIVAKAPKIGRSDYVFTPDGKQPLSGFGCRKSAFDKIMLAQLRKLVEEVGEDSASIQLPRWTIHDLRRTARTLLSQAGVPSEHAEAALGHVKKGVEGTYDRHQYRTEKKAAFAKLADLIDRIVNPGANVVAFAERANIKPNAR
jgi:integrase